MRAYTIFFKNGLILTISTIFLKTMSIFFSMFLSNSISSSDLGCFSIIMSIFSFLLTIALSGINLSSTRLISQEYSYGKKENIPNIMKNCFIYCLFFSAISIIILIIFKDYILRTMSQKSSNFELIYLLALTLPSCSISSCLSGYFMAVEKIKQLIISQSIETIVQILLTIVFYRLGLFTTTYTTCKFLILGIIISDAASAIYSISVYRKHINKYKSNYKIQKRYMRDIIRISFPVAITSYIKSGLSTLKTAMIPVAFMKYGLSHEESLSYYGIITGTVLTLMLFPYTLIQSYNSLLVPKISSYNPKKNLNTIIRITKKSLQLTFIFASIVSIIFALFAHKINITFYKNLDITYYIKVFAPIIIYIYMDNVIDSILKSLDCQIYVVIINILDVLITILLINLFIPKVGVTAYIIILYVSEIFNFVISFFILNRRINKLR